jgi:hypothetical protein
MTEFGHKGTRLSSCDDTLCLDSTPKTSREMWNSDGFLFSKLSHMMEQPNPFESKEDQTGLSFMPNFIGYLEKILHGKAQL